MAHIFLPVTDDSTEKPMIIDLFKNLENHADNCSDCFYMFAGLVNEKIDFMVDARNAGRGKLTGKLTGVNYHTDVEVKDLGDGRYACHYLVPQAGAYVLSLMWNGQHVPDSPYKVTVKEPQLMKASNCRVEGTKNISYNVHRTVDFAGKVMTLSYVIGNILKCI